MRDGRMHQTTVRFGPDLWEALEAVCSHLGVSVAQYLREAALARIAYTAGRRGERDYDAALVAAGAPSEGAAVEHRAEPVADEMVVGESVVVTQSDVRAASRAVASTAAERALESSALEAQSELVRARAQVIRAQSQELRKKAEEQRWQRR